MRQPYPKRRMLITLFGKPGSGKTTFGDFLRTQHGFLHLALSRLLQCKSFLTAVGISPHDMTNAFGAGRTISAPSLFDWLDSTILNADRSVVVDGYPREPAALERFNVLARRLVATTDIIALRLICSRDAAIQRILLRGRPDDTPGLIHARLNDYQMVQKPLFDQLDPCIQRIETSETDLAALASSLSPSNFRRPT